MKILVWMWILLLPALLLSGCGATMHLNDRGDAEKARLAAPAAKVTRTVTVTEQVSKPVPLYQIQTTTTTATKTVDDHGKPAADLHKAEVLVPKLPEPK